MTTAAPTHRPRDARPAHGREVVFVDGVRTPFGKGTPKTSPFLSFGTRTPRMLFADIDGRRFRPRPKLCVAVEPPVLPLRPDPADVEVDERIEAARLSAD